MSKLDHIKISLHYAFNKAIKPLDKAIKLIPDDKLHWKPVEEAMSISELVIHTYIVSFVAIAGTLWGEFSEADYSLIPFDPSTVTSSREIMEYGTKVKQFVQEALPKLTDADMEKEVTYHCWGGVETSGFEALSTILEEIIHHRGQLCLYLRMLGIKPPFIYDYS